MEDNKIKGWENPTIPSVPRTINAMLSSLAKHIPDWKAAKDANRFRTFAELNQISENMAAALQKRGIKPGNVVFLDLPVGVELLESFLAVTRMGAIALFLHGLFRHEDVESLISVANPVLCIGQTIHSTNLITVYPSELTGEQSILEFVTDEKDVAWYRTTSGTTGRPKVIAVEHRQLCRRIQFPGPHYQPGYVYGAPLPYAFIGYQIVTALGTGGTVVFRPSSTAVQVRRFIEEEELDYLWGVPALLQQMARVGGGEACRSSSLKAITSSGANLPLEILQIIEADWGVPVFQFYGQSELGFLTECLDDSPKKSLGKSVPGIELRILDELGRTLPPGADGRIQVMMDPPFGGYITGEASPVDAEGWVNTGDLGHLDHEGNLFLSGRESDQIQVGGLKVNAGEIVDYIKGMKGIKEIYVFPAQHPLRGEVVAVAASVEPQVEIGDIRKFCRKMPRHKQPGPIYLLPHLPLTPLGKVDKSALMAMITKQNIQ